MKRKAMVTLVLDVWQESTDLATIEEDLREQIDEHIGGISVANIDATWV